MTEDIGFPELTDSFLSGQDVFYSQFNDISFYIEDTDQEHFYYHILKKIFPDVKFEKIFPLNGKANVINEALNNRNYKNRVYIVDLDFDELLNKKDTLDNLFYLERYSIENYLIDKTALWEIIREKNPKLKDSDIESMVDFEKILNHCKDVLTELCAVFLIINENSLPEKYFKIEPDRDIIVKGNTVSIKRNFIDQYIDKVKVSYRDRQGDSNFIDLVNDKMSYFDSVEKIITNAPGKYLLALLKYQLIKLRVINSISLDTFTYKLAKEADLKSLLFLKESVNNFLAM